MPPRFDPHRRTHGKRVTTIHYHGRTDDGEVHSLTFSINGIRWEYFLTSQRADSAEYIAKTISALKALSFTKRVALRSCRLDPLPTSTLFQRHAGAQASRAKRMKVTLPDV